jgi:diguanylate cyclase (GGDEF)-like protein
VRRHVGEVAPFRRGEDVLKFIALCALASAIAPTFALIPLAAGGSLPWHEGLRNWWTWWQGDLSGMLVVAPLLLSWSARHDRPWPWEKKAEAALFGALLAAAAVVLTSGNAGEMAPLALTFVALPFILWAAFRFGQREVSTAIAVVCAIGIAYSLENDAPAASAPLNERLLLLLTFNAMVVATGLVLATVLGERARALQALRTRHDQLESSAHFDQVTGLQDAALFRRQLAQLLATAAEGGRKLALAIMDLEHFKMVNDSVGRAGGDALLKRIAERLVSDIGAPAIIARAEGDRFAIASYGFRDEAAIAKAASERMKRWFGAPYRLGESEIRLAARMGLAVFPDDGGDPDLLYLHAEAALKKAKHAGERCVFYTQKMSERAAEKLSLETRLRRAVEQEEFVLFYQPKVDVHSRKVCGLEALMRWQSPELGLVSPLQFIPRLEESGLILEVGRWALQQAARDQARWADEGVAVPRVAVNVSSIQLRHPRFAEHVREAMAGAGAPRIDLEITESQIMEDIARNILKLGELRALGIGIAIDDFGTGYSSLAYLAKLPASVLKIDRSFIGTMLEDDDAMMLVQTILSLAKSLKLTTVAEGVESEAQADMLALLGCDEMQGYLISAAVPRDEIAPLLSLRATR